MAVRPPCHRQGPASRFAVVFAFRPLFYVVIPNRPDFGRVRNLLLPLSLLLLFALCFMLLAEIIKYVNAVIFPRFERFFA